MREWIEFAQGANRVDFVDRMSTLHHQVHINAPRELVYEAVATLTGVARWWDAPVATQAPNGEVWEFRPGSEHGVLRMKIVDRMPYRRVEWKCISTHPDASPASAWTGTHVVFEVAEHNGAAVLDFRHIGWDAASPYYGFCNFHWAQALAKLKAYCEPPGGS